MRGATRFETFPVIKVEPGLAQAEERRRKRRQPGMPRSRSSAQKKKKRRGRPLKVKKLFLVSNGNGMWEVKHKPRSGRTQNVSRETHLDDVSERSLSKTASSSKNVEPASGEWSCDIPINGDLLLDGDVKTRGSPRARNKCSRTPCNTQVRNSLINTEVYECTQPENSRVSTSDSSLINNIDAYAPASPDDEEADPDVVIVEEVDENDPDVIIVEEAGEADADVIIVEEVTNQTLGKEWCADRGSEPVFDLGASPDVHTEEFVDTDCSREVVAMEVTECSPENYAGFPDARWIEPSETEQWRQPLLPADQWEQQPLRRSQLEADYEMPKQTLSQIPPYPGPQIQKQRILEELLEMNRVQLPRASPQPQELVPLNVYRWHKPQAFPERCQNRNSPPTCQCGSVHETAVDRPAKTVDRQTWLQDSRLVLCEEQVEKETRIGNASQFLKTFHEVLSECEDAVPHEAVFQDPETPFRQHCQCPTAQQEFSEKYEFQHSYGTVKTEEYQFQHSSRTVKTIFTNSIPSQRFIAAQSVAVDRQVIYKEEYKIIPQPQLEWNISDGDILGDMNMDLNFSRGTLVGVSP
ncbi:uncharacterized protein LOC126278051 isoform X2 [Schistocerca gregaria]|uniref:uncharacterized protein LOC126278051 isoform X2 n=1 Tax=Schistocerca gregaria TaxID=7010 RepID=UPI00211DB65D|nr:uncharacterized protein LOC126278051 isoform X2 [Schistocerca gregaria]